ncbi:MAG: MFS transporter [Treponema sp.]|jgi:MFS family permease|nr:MFS transporter [Treponema sp.]
MSANPFLDAPNNKKTITLAGIYLGLISQLFVSTGVSTLLPIAAEEIGGRTLYPLASNIGGLVSIIAMPLYGYLASKNPAAKRTLVSFSLLIGTLVSFVRAIAPDMMTVVAVSVLWGLVSAGIYVLGFSMIRDMYDERKAGLFLGATGTVMSIGMLAGPAITGLLIDLAGWRIVCHMNWVLMFVAAVLIFFGVKITKEEGAAVGRGGRKFDVAGCIILMLFMGGVVLALSFGPSSSGISALIFGSIGNTALLVLSAVSLAALFFIVRKKGDGAILPSGVLKDRNTVCLALYNLFATCSTMAVMFFMPAYARYVMQTSATQAALTTTMIAVLGIFLSPIFGSRIAKAKSARGVVALGTIVRIGLTIALLFVLKPTTSILVVYALILAAGLYNSQHSVTISAGPQIQIAPEIRVMGNSVVQLTQIVGGAVGMAVYTSVIGTQGVESGMGTALIIAAVTALAALICGLFLKPRNVERVPEQA